MSTPITCFLLSRTGRYRVSLRRFRYSDEGVCRPYAGCDAEAHVDEVTGEGREIPRVIGDDPTNYPHDDPRWPKTCATCGRAFADADQWQVNYHEVYTRSDGGPECTLKNVPPGGMYDAHWMRGSQVGPDGKSLILKLPNGVPWFIDGGSTNGNGWTRTGEAPRITARPSILADNYHGWLTDGVLTPC